MDFHGREGWGRVCRAGRRFVVAAVVAVCGAGRAGAAAEPATPADAFAQGLAAAESLKQAAAFDEALARLTALRGEFPARIAEVDAALGGVRSTKRQAAGLMVAVERLEATDPQTAVVVEEKLMEAGETACILLRKVVREGPDGRAARAARLLADLRDGTAHRVIAERLARNVASPARAGLVAGLAGLPEAADARQVAALWVAVKDEPRFAQRDIADLLCRVADAQCGGVLARLDEVVALPGVGGQLKAYLEDAACCTNDPGAAAWGIEQSGRFDLLTAGLRGAYFTGADFETPAFERLDEKIEFPGGEFGYPDKRRDTLSIRWTGKFVAAQAGVHKFRVNSDDGHRVWLDNRPVIDAWDRVGESRGEVELTAGPHDLRVEYKACPQPNHITAYWGGPEGGADRVLAKDVCRAVAPRAAVTAAKP